MEKETKIIIVASAIIVSLFGFILLTSKKRKAKSVSNVNTPVGNAIVNIPDGIKETDLIVVYGGMSYATPEWMLSQIPDSIKKSNIIVAIPYTTNYGAVKSSYESILSEKGVKFKNVSFVGFSAGGIDVFENYSKNFKVVGFIDPSITDNYVNSFDAGNNAIIIVNPENWSSTYTTYTNWRKGYEKLIDKISGAGGKTEVVSMQHSEIPKYFFEKFENKFA